MINQYLIDKYVNLCGFDKLTKSNNKYNARCSICGDSQKNSSKRRFYILMDNDKIVIYCHNCLASLNFSNFLKQYKPHLYEDYKNELFMNQIGFKTKKEDVDVEAFKNVPKQTFNFTPEILKNLIKVRDNKEALDFCKRRMFLESFIDKLYYTNNYIKYLINNNIRSENDYSYIPELDKRVITPIYNRDKKLALIQGRTIDSNNDYKYITTSLNDSDMKIWGEDNINKSENVYILEGIYDAYFISNSLALLGSSIDYNYIIDNYNTEKTIFIFDNDIQQNTHVKKQAKEIVEKGFSIVLFPDEFKYKDINEAIIGGMTIEQIMNIIKNNTFNNFEAQVRLKML